MKYVISVRNTSIILRIYFDEAIYYDSVVLKNTKIFGTTNSDEILQKGKEYVQKIVKEKGINSLLSGVIYASDTLVVEVDVKRKIIYSEIPIFVGTEEEYLKFINN